MECETEAGKRQTNILFALVFSVESLTVAHERRIKAHEHCRPALSSTVIAVKVRLKWGFTVSTCVSAHVHKLVFEAATRGGKGLNCINNREKPSNGCHGKYAPCRVLAAPSSPSPPPLTAPHCSSPCFLYTTLTSHIYLCHFFYYIFSCLFLLPSLTAPCFFLI